MTTADSYDHEVAVIGAGPGGIAAGAMLQQAGIRDFVILERADEMGGSWRDNTYPGICVDLPALAYQYSFARNARWTRLYPGGAEVRSYHLAVAERFGLRRHVRLSTDIAREVWDEERHLWKLHTADGRVITARFLISAVGAFLKPREHVGIPDMDKYRGKIQRPASWDHSFDHTGLRVAVIGTGASSVQITPSIAPAVQWLQVYQRTPVWCLPKYNPELPPWFRRALAIPGVAAALHGGTALMAGEILTRLLSSVPLERAGPILQRADDAAKRRYAAYVRQVVNDPETARQLAPWYGPMAKRPTFSSTYLQAFNRDNVQLITERIERFTEKGLLTADGTDHQLDMIVLATGYEMFSDPESYRPGTITGRNGFDLSTFYNEHRLQAYESTALPGLPNRWMLIGPYSWTIAGYHVFIETNARHAVRAITAARRRRATAMEVRQNAHDAYDAELRRRGEVINYYYTVLNKDVRTYYVNAHGDTPFFRPSSLIEARWHARHFPLDDYTYGRLGSLS
ncbi:flavin-containing monooxygenase [Streptomyces sp. NBC_01304]|uniref:flavin-containing monooxygenase n=1 Tax=Streptomyces sp. NBC_01304 TaxID=2903818 RepID=UPI002E134159|nr:NAD(P)/FAD-dependent oxidoreductase [Streptomyces sp. NBC_01304]